MRGMCRGCKSGCGIRGQRSRGFALRRLTNFRNQLRLLVETRSLENAEKDKNAMPTHFDPDKRLCDCGHARKERSRSLSGRLPCMFHTPQRINHASALTL